tara:strand:+ start:2091 stop:2807 length:717 start_codon:yes stop_codon:yes gene_type:complete
MNFLELVNDVSLRVNETSLDSSNFASAQGYYSSAKSAVNSSIRMLNQDAFQWPFNYVEYEQVLTAGTMRYEQAVNAKSLDFNTFRVKRDDTFGNKTELLSIVDYEEHLNKHVDDEYNTADTSIRGLPRSVIRAPGNMFLLHPSPKEDYTLVYEYYALPIDLDLYSDVPSTPASFRHVIVDGAMYYINTFRNDNESAQMALGKFREGVKQMRSIYMNRYEYVRDTRTHGSSAATNDRVS